MPNLFEIAAICTVLAATAAASNPPGGNRPWPKAPLTRKDVLDEALVSSPAILKGKQDVEESYALALQQRSAATPRLTGSGSYAGLDRDRIETTPIPGGGVRFQPDEAWQAQIAVSQTLLDGGKLRSSLRQARITREAALANYQAVVADTLLNIRIAYEDALLATQQIGTQEASVELLTQELRDTQRRFDAGTSPQFNVLRAQVQLASQKPLLIKARNDFRVAKNNLATLLGWTVPKDAGDDIPLSLSDKLEARAYDMSLPTAVAKGLQQRPEIVSAQATQKLRREDVIQARSGYYPTLAGSAGYGFVSRVFGPTFSQSPSLTDEVHGWSVGATANWSIWDFGLTQGKVKAAEAEAAKAQIDFDDLLRRIEQEIRTAHSTLVEARETLDSQAKVIEQAVEALRLARARAEAGTGTQLDVLDAQTSLTQTRTTYDQALHDYTVAGERLRRATGDGVVLKMAK